MEIMELICEGGCRLDLNNNTIDFQRMVIRFDRANLPLTFTTQPKLVSPRQRLLAGEKRKVVRTADLPWDTIDQMIAQRHTTVEIHKALVENGSIPSSHKIHAFEMHLAKHKRELNERPESVVSNT